LLDPWDWFGGAFGGAGAQCVQNRAISVILSPSAEHGASIALGAAGVDEQWDTAIENSFLQVDCRHSGQRKLSRSVSF
jgi:hypothetical protein